MKRHINSLLQRKRADFDDAQNSRRPSEQRREIDSGFTQEVLVKDGYDWLHQMQQSHAITDRHSNV